MRRRILGLITLALFVFAAIVNCYPPWESYRAAGLLALRAGLVLGAFWLAWPDLHRLPKWFWYSLPLAALLLIYARSALIFLIPLFAAAGISYMLYRKLWRPSR